VLGNEQRLTQVMLNLLQNAIKHAPGSEQIDVRVRSMSGIEKEGGTGTPGRGKMEKESMREGKHREMRTDNRSKEMVQIEVQDYGPGIATEDLPTLFTPFHQTRREGRAARGGLGLGLFICKGIVEQHGGTIEIESIVGKGSTFIIRLPLLSS